MASPSLILAVIIVGLVLTVVVVLALIAALVWIGLKLIACIVAFVGWALAGSVLAVVVLLLVLAALALLYWFIFVVHRLPLFLVGLGNLTHMPAVPFILSELPGTVVKLRLRSKQTEQAKHGLSTEYTLG